MINFKITGLDNTFLTIEKSTGKTIPLKLGEIVKAEVMDILPAGGVILKIKGDFITAKATIPLNKGAEAFFKIAALSLDGKELKLQFMGYETGKSEVRGQKSELFFTSPEGKVIYKLIQELENNLKGSTFQNSKLQTLNSELLKALPQDINALPKETRMQLQNLLQASLKATGQSIQTRLDSFIAQLPVSVKNHPLIETIKQDLMVNMEKLLQTPLKSALQDTGVALEAKLKTIASILQHMEQADIQANVRENVADKDIALSKLQTSLMDDEMVFIRKDLKAVLLQLKELLIEDGRGAIKTVDGLLKDIETFQALSKTTDSFYTFLPVAWRELKDGEVSFKKGQSDFKGSVYSCRINLDLERFGRLSVVVMMYNKEFFISFKAENSGFQSLLDRNVSELHDNFREKGLSLKSVNVLDVNEQLERFESSENSVNIKV
ncbi:MAG: flagellar hook-length control protein FliK [Thermodesulfovibrionales bacterium]|nr:flagellar hook-length control protein FliK [Thermodesulfovibrionales bacterium]